MISSRLLNIHVSNFNDDAFLCDICVLDLSPAGLNVCNNGVRVLLGLRKFSPRTRVTYLVVTVHVYVLTGNFELYDNELFTCYSEPNQMVYALKDC